MFPKQSADWPSVSKLGVASNRKSEKYSSFTRSCVCPFMLGLKLKVENKTKVD